MRTSVTVKTSSGAPFTLDWPAWTPKERATLLFFRIGGKLLLILKKRGLGKGKFNAPGGRMEPGETPRDTAIRETREEVGLTPLDPVERGRLDFVFTDGYSLSCRVFTATAYTGTLAETDEAKPFWCDESAVPYANMWADDRLWLPKLLAGEPFHGRFIFEGDSMLSLEFLPE